MKKYHRPIPQQSEARRAKGRGGPGSWALLFCCSFVLLFFAMVSPLIAPLPNVLLILEDGNIKDKTQP